MSLGTPVHALNLQTNINGNRYFFATQEAGEQQLYLSTSVVAGLSTQSIGISGPAGNEVNYTTAPYFAATEFIGADQGLAVGGASTYWTASTINSTITGISMSSDRTPGTGTGTIEAYSGNGSSKGLEFLTRGVNSQVISSINTNMNNYLSSLGNPGAGALLRQNGSMFAGDSFVAPYFTSLNEQAGPGGRPAYGIQDLSGAAGITPVARWAIGTSGIAVGGGTNAGSDFTLFSYDDSGNFIESSLIIKRSNGAMTIANLSTVNGVRYPQNLLSTVGVANQTGLAVPISTPTVIYTITNPNLVPNNAYLCDTAFSWQVGNPGVSGAFVQLGLRLGGNGNFNYDVPNFIPPGGTGPIFISNSVNQIADMGTTNQNIDIIAYHNNATPISISTNTTPGGGINYFKMLT